MYRNRYCVLFYGCVPREPRKNTLSHSKRVKNHCSSSMSRPAIFKKERDEPESKIDFEPRIFELPSIRNNSRDLFRRGRRIITGNIIVDGRRGAEPAALRRPLTYISPKNCKNCILGGRDWWNVRRPLASTRLEPGRITNKVVSRPTSLCRGAARVVIRPGKSRVFSKN